MSEGEHLSPWLRGLWRALARELRLTDEEADGLATLTERLLASGELSYEAARDLVGDDVLLLAHDLGLIVPSKPRARCLEWDATPLGPGTSLRLNPAVEAVLKALEAGKGVLDGLASLMSELGLEGRLARRMAEVALELASERTVAGADIAAACRSHGLSGFESQAVAILKAAGAISPILATTWPSEDVRYRTCVLLSHLTRLRLQALRRQPQQHGWQEAWPGLVARKGGWP